MLGVNWGPSRRLNEGLTDAFRIGATLLQGIVDAEPPTAEDAPKRLSEIADTLETLLTKLEGAYEAWNDMTTDSFIKYLSGEMV